MNVGAVDMNGAIASGPVAATEPRIPVVSSQASPPSGGDAAAKEHQIKEIVEKMQEQIDSMNVSLQYSTYGEHGEKIAVAVVNKETGELIREIPSKELQNLYAKMSELAGMIFNRMI